jgi:hypothetical protein
LNHHWSGWPGAWCLDCGIEDPVEIALAHYGIAAGSIPIPECKEPGSNRCNPYVKRLIEWSVNDIK